MAPPVSAVKQLIRIDIISDTVCPWCFIGKKHLEKAMDASRDRYNFEVRWHPFLLYPNAPKEGNDKMDIIRKKLGEANVGPILAREKKVFADLGIDVKHGGLIGPTLDSHRLINLAGQQGLDKQNALVEELFINHFTQEKYIADRKVLLEAAAKVGVDGAEECLNDPNFGLKEVQEDLQKYARTVTGVPYYLINNHHQLAGGQPPEAFLKTFRLATTGAAPREELV